MNKRIFLIIFLLTCRICNAQVSYEHGYHMNPSYITTPWFITDIGYNNYKYVTEDSTGFSLYNLDHSPYLLNFVTPIPLWQQPSYYEVAYITNSLFDCDSTTLEYAIVCNPSYIGNFYIYRTDGTLIFQRDSSLGMYCFGCADGSFLQQPIVSTPDGTKMFLFGYNQGYPDSIYVYSLCGNLPTNISDIPINESFIKIFPNPTNGKINFFIDLPNSIERFELNIYTPSFQKIETNKVRGNNYQLDVRDKNLPSGTYLFELRTINKVFQTGKFVIAR